MLIPSNPLRSQMIEKHATAQSSSLQELQTDIKSLRTLLQARRPLTPSVPASSSSTSDQVQGASSSSPSSSSPPKTSTSTQPPPASAEANALLAPRPSVPSRSGTGLANGSSSTGANLLGNLAGNGGRPSIPAWQLEAEKKEQEKEVKAKAEAGDVGEKA